MQAIGLPLTPSKLLSLLPLVITTDVNRCAPFTIELEHCTTEPYTVSHSDPSFILIFIFIAFLRLKYLCLLKTGIPCLFRRPEATTAFLASLKTPHRTCSSGFPILVTKESSVKAAWSLSIYRRTDLLNTFLPSCTAIEYDTT